MHVCQFSSRCSQCALRLFSMMILFCAIGCAAGLSSEQKAMVNEIYMSTYELPNHARRVFISPNGILEVETTENQGAYDTGVGSRTFINVHTGQQIWSGPLRGSLLLTDTPAPILAEISEQNYTVSALRSDGQTVWQFTNQDLFVFGLEQENQGMFLILSLKKMNNQSVHAILQGYALSDGKNKWRTDLGEVSLGDHALGSLWRYQSRPVFGHQGKAFLLLENKAIGVDVISGQVLSDKPIPLGAESSIRGDMTWLVDGGNVMVVSGPHVVHLSEHTNQHWYAYLGSGKSATDAVIMDNELIITLDDNAERCVALLDSKTGTIIWQSSVKANGSSHATGSAVLEDRIVVASFGQLHAFERKTGTLLYSEKISKQVDTLINHNGGIILIGPTSIERRNHLDGSMIWGKEDLNTPLSWYYGQRQSSMAAIKASLETAAAISANQARWSYNQAGKKMGGSYTHDTWTRSQYSKLGNSAAASAAASKFGASLVDASGSSASFIDRKVSIIVDMPFSEPLKDRAYFLVPVQTKVLTGQTNTAKVLVVNFEDGTTKDIPVRKAPMTCIPSVMVSERLGLIIQAYHKFPFCKAARTIDILKLPSLISN